MNPDSSARSAELSTTRKHTGAIWPQSDGLIEFERFGGSGENTSRSLEQPCSKPSMPELRVEFTPWRLTQSQFRYRGTPNTYDLGVIR